MRAHRLTTAVAGALFVVAGGTVPAQERPGWSDSCADIHDHLAAAFADAPDDMALGNRTKIERLLRDARVAPDRAVCITKLERAHALLEMAYDDAGTDLAVIAGDG